MKSLRLEKNIISLYFKLFLIKKMNAKFLLLTSFYLKGRSLISSYNSLNH